MVALVSMDREPARALNLACDCISTDAAGLAEALGRSMPDDWVRELGESHPNLFASVPVFVARPDLERMEATVDAVTRVVGSQAYRDAVLAEADEVTRLSRGAQGVFLGFDFHLGADGPRLIEINTNAGGALLQLALAQAQRPCCEIVERAFAAPRDLATVEARIVAMFVREFERVRPGLALRHVAIVDERPAEQFLRPEFELFVALFARHGILATIADPSELIRDARGLVVPGVDLPVDFVYLRSTDFRLATPECATLRRAYLDDVVVVSPPPIAHALYADKANLALLSDERWLRAHGVADADVATLVETVPETKSVRGFAPDALWSDRRDWFFKPRDGFASRAAYRGDKLTRRTFDSILAEADRYVGQRVVPPSERLTATYGTMKFDVRDFVYDGESLLFAARLYRGQTTNLRTPGGGLAAVLGPRGE